MMFASLGSSSCAHQRWCTRRSVALEPMATAGPCLLCGGRQVAPQGTERDPQQGGRRLPTHGSVSMLMRPGVSIARPFVADTGLGAGQEMIELAGPVVCCGSICNAHNKLWRCGDATTISHKVIQRAPVSGPPKVPGSPGASSRHRTAHSAPGRASQGPPGGAHKYT